MIHNFKIMEKRPVGKNMVEYYFQFTLEESGPYFYSGFAYFKKSGLSLQNGYYKSLDEAKGAYSKRVAAFTQERRESITQQILNLKEFRLRHLFRPYTFV